MSNKEAVLTIWLPRRLTVINYCSIVWTRSVDWNFAGVSPYRILTVRSSCHSTVWETILDSGSSLICSTTTPLSLFAAESWETTAHSRFHHELRRIYRDKQLVRLLPQIKNLCQVLDFHKDQRLFKWCKHLKFRYILATYRSTTVVCALQLLNYFFYVF